METSDYFSQTMSYRMNYNIRPSNNDPLLPPSPSSSSSSLPRQLTESPLDNETNTKAKKELIQQATTRLRCKTLLYGLDEIRSKVAELQSELDNLRIEVDTTENVLSKFDDHPNDRQLQALEKRFRAHQQQLDHVLSSCKQQQLSSVTRPPTPPDSNAPTTLSSTLLRVSSIFRQNRSNTPTTLPSPTRTNSATSNNPQHLSISSSSSTCSSNNYNSDTATPSMKETRDRQKQRRERVKQIKQKYQASIGSCDWNVNGGWSPTQQPSTNTADKEAPINSEPIPSEQPPCKGKAPKQKNTTPETIDKRRTAGQKKPMTTSTAPKPAQCLCKRKTNKPEPVKHHKAASFTTQTYHSKQPEMASLAPDPCPAEITVMPDPLQDHTTATTKTIVTPDEPPLPPIVTEWLEQQQEYQPTDYDTPMKQTSDAYEDVLRYLDTISDFGNDIGLQQDITHLLSPLKSTWSDDSSYSSYDDWDPPRRSFYHHMRLYSLLIDHGLTRLSQYVMDGMRKGVAWTKFLSVLAVALLISLGRGPDQMLLSLDDIYYLECLAEDGFVDSYFL